MRNLILAFVSLLYGQLLLGTAACSPAPAETVSPFREKCEALLETMLKSPSSLKIIESREGDWHGDTKEISIVYDADNSFGAALRGSFSCSFLSDPDWWGDDPKGRVDMRTDSLEAITPQQLVPYKIVSDDDTLGGSKTEPDVRILFQTSQAFDILQRRDEARK